MKPIFFLADKFGFRAKIRTSEPGTAQKNPASIMMEAKPLPVSSIPTTTRSPVLSHLSSQSYLSEGNNDLISLKFNQFNLFNLKSFPSV